jgi:OFA family oxalate/formate antiporter-like MFS transporter
MTSDTPTTSTRRRLFYGWWIVVGAVIAQFASMGASGQIGGVFLRPMTEDLEWSAAQYTLGGAAAFVFGGLAGFVIGPLVDRHGPRPLMLVGMVCYSGALFGMSRQQELWQFIVLSMLAGGAGVSLIGPLVVNVTLSKWFVRHRGWAIALGSMGISLSGLIAPVTMTQVVDSTGWRDAYVVLSVAIIVLVLPVALLMRRSPEDYGMLPDGQHTENVDDEELLARAVVVEQDAANSYTRAEALRTRSLWALTLGFGLNLTAMSAILVHGIPFMTDTGFTRTEASVALAVNGLGNLLSKFVWGWGLERFEARLLSTGAFALSATGVSLMLVATATDALPVLFLGFFAWGFGFGGTLPLGEFLWARYFGRRYLGAVRSVGVPFTIIFGSAGPILVGLYFDSTSTYEGAFLVLALIYVAGGATIFSSRQPPPKAEARQIANVEA